MFLKTDRMDRLMYREQRSNNPGLPDLEEAGKPKMERWPGVVPDLWSGLYKAAPEMDPQALESGGPLAKAMDDVMQTAEWKKLRTQTKLDEFGSSVGTVAFGKNFLENIPKEVLDAEQAALDAKQAQEAIEDNANDPSIPPEFLARAREHAEKLRERAQRAIRLAEEKTGGDIPQAVRIAAREAAEKAVNQTAEAKEMAFAWGNEAGSARTVPVAEQIRLANKIKGNRILELLAKMVGRMKRLAEGFQARKIDRCPEEIVDVELGDNLASVLPSELMKIGIPASKLDFVRRYMEKSLLQYKKTGTDKAGKGPIVLIRDESGSMSGEPFAWACAIALSLAWIAQKQKRDLILGGFSAGGCFWSREFERGKMTPQDVEFVAAHYFGGGTDFEMALTRSFDAIQKSRIAKKADLIFLSDGDCYITPGFKKDFLNRKKEMAIRIISIGVGVSEESFKDFSDQAFGLKNDLTKDEEALEKVFSL